MKTAIRTILLPAVTFLVVLAAWHGASILQLYPEHLFPSPLTVAKGAEEIFKTGELWQNVWVSLLRFAAGYGAAAFLALPLGLLFGRCLLLWSAVDPLIQVLRPVSPIAWFPLISLWFGIGNLPAVVIIFLAAFYPILLTTVAAVKNVPPVYLKVAKNLGASRRKVLWDVIVPAAFPQITVGLHIAIGAAWVFLVAGEMLGVRSGLGYLIIDSRNNLRTDLVIVGIIFIGVSGLVIDRLMGLAERWVKRQWGAA
ncbi:ABC transporter permease [Geobacter sp. DSM 9736]|uniref:ABC transporter permease n=1 Tax=Geobacter sp. DSM 9736 TaxID=1277350 RepID=UPI000B613C3F|nr:ABC transporter permease [Geobacter sp. DSM 9736]SNB45128.1 NitT/TauT family transport system permease protein [Geobacter sp. DSM 9736]